MTANKIRKKSKFTKKSKKAWRATDIKDVEDFYETQLLEERLGGPFSEKPDEELFFVQKCPDDEANSKTNQLKIDKISSKRKRALAPPKCFAILENSSLVPDPISKRNRTKTKEERKSRIQKEIEDKLKKQGVLKQKEIIAARNRLLNRKILKLKKKKNSFKFDKDVWADENKGEEEIKEWLEEDTHRNYVTNTGKLEVKVPKSLRIKTTVLPPIENPHPGTSYNPAPEDHRQLLEIVAEKEMKMKREEERIDRATTSKFRKISPQEAMNNWFAEMSQGLVKNDNDEDDDEEDDNKEYKPVNPPALLKRKPLKEKKKAKIKKAEELEKQKSLIEKKKLTDLHRLKSMKKEILLKEKQSELLQEKRKELKAGSLKKTKKLGPIKFSAPLLDFKRSHELQKNLRALKTEGSILTDRFFSLQKRNIIEPRLRVRKQKTKVKRFFKPGYKYEDSEVKKMYDEIKKIS